MKAKDFFGYIKKKVTTAYIAKLAMLSAIAFLLYMYVKFKLPFMFPSFLEMQFSELPAMLAGFSMGPVAGALVIIIKCLLKFPFSGTAFVGEIMDLILGILYVVPASIAYQIKKNKKWALIGLAIGTVSATVMGMLLNRFLAVPFYVSAFFGNNFDALVGMCSPLYPGLTKENFYNFYIFVAVLPFNLLRLGIVSLITFMVYKRLSKILHWEIKKKSKKAINEENNEPTETDVKEEDIEDKDVVTVGQKEEEDI